MNTDTTTVRWTEEARELGREAGKSYGTWAADGNTTEEHRRHVLAMLADGDPEAYDYLPNTPNLSGEWADDPTPLSLARDVSGEQYPDDDLVDALAEAWEAGVAETFEDTCAAELRAGLPA